MSIRKKQSEFVRMVGRLIQFANERGYELTFGDAWARMGHKNGSFHYKRLAIDLNLFKNNAWMDKTEDHAELGEFWESIGGTWGGRFKNSKGASTPDGNHYSLGEN